MNILIPTIDPMQSPGGVARYIRAIQQTFPNDVEVMQFDQQCGRIKLFFSLAKNIQVYKKVFTHHIFPIGTMLCLLSYIYRKPYIIFFHGMDFDLAQRNWWKKLLSRSIISRAFRIVVNSKALGQEIENAYEMPQSPLVVYPCVEDAFVEASFVTRKISDGRFRLLTISRLVERKGHIDVLNAIHDLKNFEYSIVGDGKMRPEIEQKIAELGLRDSAKLLRHVNDRKLPFLYANADIFVMPCKKTPLDREGFGIVYLEAQLFGVPVIAMNTVGVQEAVKGGILLNDISELPEAIKRLSASADLRIKLGKEGREFVLTNFTREKQMRKLEILL